MTVTDNSSVWLIQAMQETRENIVSKKATIPGTLLIQGYCISIFSFKDSKTKTI